MVGVLPYQVKRKLGLNKIEIDPFVKELGVFTANDNSSCERKLIERFRKNWLVSQYRFNTMNIKLELPRLSFELTHHLNLQEDIEKIRNSYSQNIKRNLKKATSNSVEIRISDDLELLISLFKNNVAHKIPGILEHQYDILRDLFKQMNDRGLCKIYTAFSALGQPLSSALLVKSGNMLIYFFAASSQEGKELNSQSLLLDHIIEHYSQSDFILDFEGGSTDGLKRFYSGFGSKELQIPTYRRMIHSALLEKLK